LDSPSTAFIRRLQVIYDFVYQFNFSVDEFLEKDEKDEIAADENKYGDKKD